MSLYPPESRHTEPLPVVTPPDCPPNELAMILAWRADKVQRDRRLFVQTYWKIGPGEHWSPFR